MGNGNAPMVSVCMITYNHETYIKQAIEGVLMQKCNFSFELVIGEDCSTDKTLDICMKLSEANNQIRLLPSTANLGMMPNFVRTLSECKGKYIALCEGDDYWTDPYKLQKQVDFLEANEDFAICFHPVHICNQRKISSKKLSLEIPEVTTIEDLAKSNYIPTLSVIFRSQSMQGFSKELNKGPFGDYFLHLLNAQFGKIKKLPEIMGVYRYHENNSWANLDQVKMNERLLILLEIMIDYFSGNVQKELKNQYSKVSFDLAMALYKKGIQNEDFKYYYNKSLNSNNLVVFSKLINIYKSKEYKTGKYILTPLRFMKRFLERLKF
jgi:glycosyltransferase involved in cell wall biosynthesis